MKATIRAISAGLALTLIGAGPARTQGEPAWLHVRVEEGDKNVRVNLPLTVVEAALRAAPETVASGGRIHLGHRKGVRVSELRKAWAELKAAGDAELVTVEEKDQTVRVARRGSLVEIQVEKPQGKEHVHVEVPVGVVDALLAEEGDTLNVEAALKELRARRGDIVRVKDDNATVRVWIDEKN
jgi:hypothetical protein